MAPRRVPAAASPNPLRRLRLRTGQPLQHRRISRQKIQSFSIKDIRRKTMLEEVCVSTTMKEADAETETETETETEPETRWERSTRGEAKPFCVEQLYRYEEL
ncbi:hypothetical protein V8C37DRAFT_342183 [Trichoderma ceciliae]